MKTMYHNQPTLVRKIKWILVCGTAVMTLASQQAYALDEIYTPNVVYREIALEYNGNRTFDSQPEKNNIQEQQYILEVGITPRWMIETSAGYEKVPGEETKLNDIEVETRVQFFEPGEYWLDAGLLIAYGFAKQDQQPDSVEIKLLLQKDVGRFTTIVNIGFSEDIGTYSSAGGPDYALLWNTRYRQSEYFQPGIEFQIDFGQRHSLTRFNEQENYVGPTVYGRLFAHLRYQIGYYYGMTQTTAHNAARVLFEYETYF